MDLKYKEVADWLNEIFNGRQFEAFEKNDYTINYLHDLMIRNKMADENMQSVIEFHHNNISFYQNEKKRLENILERINMQEPDMQKETLRKLATLSSVANILNVENPDNSSIIMSMMDGANERIRANEDMGKEIKSLEKLKEKYKGQLMLATKLQNLQKDLESHCKVEDHDLKRKSEKAKFFHQKLSGYDKTIRRLKSELTDAELSSSLYHSALVQKSKDLQAKRDELNAVKQKLNAFHSLSPDSKLAKVELEEAKRELESIEKKLSSHIDFIHT